jgi:hypothetical protein
MGSCSPALCDLRLARPEARYHWAITTAAGATSMTVPP